MTDGGPQRILILDFGSQYTQLIARRLREMGVYCEILPCTQPFDASLLEGTLGLILSGGPDSVFAEDAPPFERSWLDVELPVLGICYGLQLLLHDAGAELRSGEHREFGPAQLEVHEEGVLLQGLESPSQVWMSHGDHVQLPLPSGWRLLGSTTSCPVTAAECVERRRFALQFHPEVTHSLEGKTVLRNFAFAVCGARGDWSMGSFLERQLVSLREVVGPKRVLCALSGGVDSSVVAALLQRAIGSQLVCVFVDTGLQRLGEAEAIREEFRELDLHIVDASERFLEALRGVEEPERKRKIIGETFIRVFEEAQQGIGEVHFLAQGTLYPDVIESVSVRGPSATIKSHHNVGGLPEDMQFELIEPLRELFKDEVRDLGRELGLSQHRVGRHPFPGPGLGIRILGSITRERCDVLRRAEAIVDEELRSAGLYEELWQCFAVLLPVKTVGVMGDKRTYESVCALRAVRSVDGMTAEWARLPWDLLDRISTRIINEVSGINRVCYDISSKPPATIEWE